MDVSEAMNQAVVIVREKYDSVPNSQLSENSQMVDPIVSATLHLDVNDLSNRQIERINQIGEWIRSQLDDPKDEMKVANMMRDIKFKLGPANLGVSYIDHVYKYVKLRMASQSAEAEAKAMEQ